MSSRVNMQTLLLLFVAFAAALGEDEMTEQILEWFEEHAASKAGAVANNLTALHAFMAANLEERLINLEEMVKGIAHRQKMYHYCTPGVCGAHGNCSVSEDAEGFACDCEEFWKGQFCEDIGPCHSAYVEQMAETPMPGSEIPRCQDDGFYAGMQYSGSMAVCVDKFGNGLQYAVHRWEVEDDSDMPCDCARAEAEHYSSFANLLSAAAVQRERFGCTERGSYPDTHK